MEQENLNPAFIRCRAEHYDAVTAMYGRVLTELERTVNYPKWTKDHPGADYVKEAIEKGEQFACVADGEILGAAVLNEDPEGNYAIGHWSEDLPDGDYLVVHILAVDPAWKNKGVGGFLVDGAIAFAKEQGYENKVVFGLLTTAFVSRLVGVLLPGRYCLLQGIDLKYTRPVYVGDILIVKGVVDELHPSVQRMSVKVEIVNQNEKKVVKGKVEVGFLK